MLSDLSCSQIEYLIDEWILSERNRKIAKRKLVDGITFEKIAEEYGLSVTQTKTIVKKTKEILDRKCFIVLE